MYSSYFRISIIAILLFVPSWVHGAIAWDNPANRDTGSIAKILGQHTLYVTQDINVFQGHIIYDCSKSPNITILQTTEPTVTPDTDSVTCGWGGCTVNTTSVCGSPGSEYDHPEPGACNFVGACTTETGCDNNPVTPSCMTHATCGGYHDEYTRTGCSRISTLKYLVDGVAFNSSTAYGYGANMQCNPGSPEVPNAGLKVEITRSKEYRWDDELPLCIRGGTISGYHNFGDGFIDDATLRTYLTTNTGAQDTTLTYEEPAADPEINRIYPGVWTNKDVIGKGKCSDEHSGCNASSLGFVYSQPLAHLQSTFISSGAFTDIAMNKESAPSCPTNIAKLSGLTRKCGFKISPIVLSGAIHDATGSGWFHTLSAADQLFLTGMIANPTPGGTLQFNTDINHLRSLSMSGSHSLSSAWHDDPLKHDRLYEFIPNSCVYTYQYSGNHLPLIDRIKPTIQVAAQIGSGLTTPDTLLQQEETLAVGMPKIVLTGSYLAGSGKIIVTLVDSGSSTFSTYPTGFNGISGMSGVLIEICQTKTHTGRVIDIDCSGTPTKSLYHYTKTVISQYNTGGTITVPDISNIEIDLDDTSGLQITGEYQVYVAMMDKAGNSNESSSIFHVVPEGFDSNRTRLDKYQNASSENASNALYTVTGSTFSNGPGVISPSYANAIDTQIYKLSIFDKYANPIYNWKLYGYYLTHTGILLDQVQNTGSGALFLHASGGITSNLGQTGTTNMDGSLRFSIASYSPGEFSEQFQFTYKLWDRYRGEIGSPISYVFPANTEATGSLFHHIFTGSFDLYTTKRIDLGTANDILMQFYTTSSTPNTSLNTFTVHNFLESLESMSPNEFIITNTGNIIGGTSSSYSPGYIFSSSYPNPSYLSGATGSFIPEQQGVGTLFLSNLQVKSFPYISLTFSGLTTQYYVSDKEDEYGSGIIYNSGILNRIHIDGLTSMAGKNGYVIQKDNMTLNSAGTRNAIHKNAALLLRNRTTGGGIINRVKYLSGDVKSANLTDLNDWDVLIVKGGNFIIGDMYSSPTDMSHPPLEDRNYYFNSGTTSLGSIPHKGIIVLKDESGSGGNIYIMPDVRFIGATLFADESVMSVNYAAKVFQKSSSSRTVLLDKQLVIYGGVLSKNTVGGAVRADNYGKYFLPWQNSTVSLDDAVRYDLAFLRMDNHGYDLTSYMNRGHGEFVVILVDPRNLTDPLPGFLVR